MATRRRSDDFDKIPMSVRRPRSSGRTRDFEEAPTVYVATPRADSAMQDLGETFVRGVREHPVASIAVAGVVFFAGGWFAASYPVRR